MSRSILTHDVDSPVSRHCKVTKETIRNRLKISSKQTSPLIEYYANKGMLKNASTLDVNELAEEIIANLKN